MKVKTKIIFSIFLLIWSSQSWANDLNVRSNVDSGNYDFALEVYLVSNDKNAKIFYYTDGIGRFDTLREFSQNDPILIKKDTTLNYYAMNELNNSTKIAESQYSFSYPENLEISHKENTIFITNNSQKTVNIGYFKIESNLLNYEIAKNTFLNHGENFTLKYSPKTDDTLNLFSPNGKKINSFLIKYTLDSSPPGEKKIEIKTEDTVTEQETNAVPEENGAEKGSQNPLETQIEVEKSDIFSNENLKASVQETKENGTNIYVLLYGFVAFLFAMTLFNIFTLIKTNRNIKNKNKKIVKK